MNHSLRILNKNVADRGLKSSAILFLFFFLASWFLNAQVAAKIDSTSIKIGAQIIYSIEVKTDTTSLVVFPEGPSFSPLEMIESYETDTLKQNDKYNLIKKYGLTQFDSGAYTIPPQKIIIGDKTFSQLTFEELAYQFDKESNSVSIIVKHMKSKIVLSFAFTVFDNAKTWSS